MIDRDTMRRAKWDIVQLCNMTDEELETVEAERIRDRLDYTWYKGSDEQREEMNAFSVFVSEWKEQPVKLGA